MKINVEGLALVKRWESLRLNAYLCPAGVATIGYGHTGDVALGQKVSEHQADVILRLDMDKFEDGVAEAPARLTSSRNGSTSKERFSTAWSHVARLSGSSS